MENPPPPPPKQRPLILSTRPILKEVPWQMLPGDMLAILKPIPPKSITQKEYFKGIPDA